MSKGSPTLGVYRRKGHRGGFSSFEGVGVSAIVVEMVIEIVMRSVDGEETSRVRR